MKLYLTSGQTKTYEEKVQWSGTKRDAARERKAMKDDGLEFVGTYEVDIPTHKSKLIQFLNTNAVYVDPQIGGGE